MKMKAAKSMKNTNICFLEVLGIVFIILKLCGVINWSWWFVLMPLYIPALVFIVAIIIFGMVMLKLKR